MAGDWDMQKTNMLRKENSLLKRTGVGFLSTLVILVVLLCASSLVTASEGPVTSGSEAHAWWFWPLTLLIVTFVMGIFAVLGGVGGGVLFVPIISGFFPFHLDFVRGTG